jgi:hypothetical protein
MASKTTPRNDKSRRDGYLSDILSLSVDRGYISCKRVGDEIRTTLWDKSFFDCDNKRIDYSKSSANTDRRASSFFRTKQSIFDYCHINTLAYPGDKYFVTLTYADNLQDIKVAKKDFSTFINRLSKLKHFENTRPAYIGVIEFQKRGAIHFHVVFFNVPFLFKNDDARNINKSRNKSDYSVTWSDLWGHGFVKVQKINPRGKEKMTGRNYTSGVARYLSKYITKSIMDDRLKGHTFYFRSKNLYKPATVYSKIKVENFHSIHNVLSGLFGLSNDVEYSYKDISDGFYFLEGVDKNPSNDFIRILSGRKINLTNEID